MGNNQLKATPLKRARRLPPAERRRELLEIGVRAFSENGIRKTVHADLAKLSGVSTPTIFHYFPTRKILTEEVLKRVATLIRDDIFSVVDAESDNPEIALLESGSAIVDFALNSPEYAKVWLMWSTLYDPELRPAYSEVEAEFLTICAKLLSQLLDNDQHQELLLDRARLIFSAGQMLLQLALENPDKGRIERYVQHVMGALLTRDNLATI